MESQITRTVVACVAAAVAVGLAVYFPLRDLRKRNRLLDRLAVSLGFRACKANDILPPSMQNPYEIVRQPAICGERQGIPIQVTVSQSRTIGDDGGYPTTSVVFVWPKPVMTPGTWVHIDRSAGESDPKPKSGLLRRISDVDSFADDPTFGWSRIKGTPAELDRVFTPKVRGALQRLPRPFAGVSCHDGILALTWKGVDEDRAIFEQSFNIGIGCLESLAPR